MGNVQSKVSYLQGLAKGLNFDSQSVEGKILVNMVEVLDSVAKEIEDIQMTQKDLEEYVDTMDEDLEHLENIIYEDNENGLLHLECPECHAEIVLEPAQTGEENTTEVACPACGSIIYEEEHLSSAGRSGRIDHRDHPGI